MITPLERPLRRLVEIEGKPYVVTFKPGGLTLVEKGRRKGVEITWKQILDGEVELHAQLVESLARSAGAPPVTASRRRESQAHRDTR